MVTPEQGLAQGRSCREQLWTGSNILSLPPAGSTAPGPRCTARNCRTEQGVNNPAAKLQITLKLWHCNYKSWSHQDSRLSKPFTKFSSTSVVQTVDIHLFEAVLKEQNCNLEAVKSLPSVLYTGKPRCSSSSSPGSAAEPKCTWTDGQRHRPALGDSSVPQWAIKSFVTNAKLLLERNKRLELQAGLHNLGRAGIAISTCPAHWPLAARTRSGYPKLKLKSKGNK